MPDEGRGLCCLDDASARGHVQGKTSVILGDVLKLADGSFSAEADRNIEIEPIINRVGIILAEIPPHAAAA